MKNLKGISFHLDAPEGMVSVTDLQNLAKTNPVELLTALNNDVFTKNIELYFIMSNIVHMLEKGSTPFATTLSKTNAIAAS